jgi:CBS domain-containing protein
LFENATVADVMHTGLITCSADATVSEIAAAMSRRRIHFVVVADGDGRRPWAVVSDLKLMGALAAGDDAPAASRAETEVLTVAPGAQLIEAARLMAKHKVNHLVVVDPRTAHPTGVISTLDIARAVV